MVTTADTTNTTTTVTTTTAPLTTNTTSSSSRTTLTFSNEELRRAMTNTENISMKIPPFWSTSPLAWFIQAEAQFDLARVNTDAKRYTHLVASLSQEVVEKVLDVIQTPPNPNTRYETLKKTILERLSLSEEKRISNILYREEIGDKSPSEFYRHLLNLAGSSATAIALAATIWKDRLPSPVDVAVIPVLSQGPQVFLELADKVWERTKSRVSSLNPFLDNSSSTNTSQNDDLVRQINELRKAVEKLSVDRSRSRSKQRSSRSSSKSKRDSSSDSKLCWYHEKYGAKATKCRKPCTYKADKSDSKN